MAHYKRKVADREITFSRPEWSCLACNDSGIVTNGDGLLTAMIKDYDVDPDTGRIHGGLDCALICHCHAAFPVQDGSGQIIRHGFRDDNGSVRKIKTEQGERSYGSSCPKDIYENLITERQILWDATEKEMNEKRRSGDKTPTPWMQDAKAALMPGTWIQTKSGFSSLSSSLPRF